MLIIPPQNGTIPSLTLTLEFCQFHVKNCIEIALKARIRHIVLVSIIGAENSERKIFQEYHYMEQCCINSHIPCTILRCEYPMEHLFLQIHAIQTNALYLPMNGSTWMPICIQDLAEICALVIRSPQGYTDRRYDLVGPDRFTGPEIAELLTDSLGISVVFNSDDVGFNEYASTLLTHSHLTTRLPQRSGCTIMAS
jgi:uncharacterized protein YbjT (DUF2867 family)